MFRGTRRGCRRTCVGSAVLLMAIVSLTLVHQQQWWWQEVADPSLIRLCPADDLAVKSRRLVTNVEAEPDFQLAASLPHTHRQPYPLPRGDLERFCRVMGEIPRSPGSIPPYCRPSLDGAGKLVPNLGSSSTLGYQFPCSNRTLVGTVKNVFLDYGTSHPDVHGSIFDAHRYMSLSPYEWEQWIPKCDAAADHFEHVEELASVVGTYGYAFAHCTVEIMPRLVTILKHVPAHVPILVEGGACVPFVRILVDAGLVAESRIIWYKREQNRIFSVKKLWLVSETPICGDRHGDAVGSSWQAPEIMYMSREAAHQAEVAIRQGALSPQAPKKPPTTILSWIERVSTSAERFDNDLQNQLWDSLARNNLSSIWRTPESLAVPPVLPRLSERKLILLGDRPNSPVRSIENAAEVVARLRSQIPAELGYDVQYFAADGVPLEVIIALFRSVRVFVSPHGATLSHMMWLPEGSSVVEIAYMGAKQMPFPATYYYAIAVALGLDYGVVPATSGEYDTKMTVEPNDVLKSVLDIIVRS